LHIGQVYYILIQGYFSSYPESKELCRTTQSTLRIGKKKLKLGNILSAISKIYNFEINLKEFLSCLEGLTKVKIIISIKNLGYIIISSKKKLIK
jgi:hypothetical protein